MSPNLETITTPALVLDRGKLAANCRRLADRIPRGVRLRPHLKTSKSIDVARIALQGHEPRATVSTLKEAEYFHQHGLSDLTYAVGVSPDKLPRAASLVRSGCQLQLITDDLGVAQQIAERGVELGVVFTTLVEVDTDGHRMGVEPASDDLLEIAGVLDHRAGAEFGGVLTHAGESYGGANAEELATAAANECAGATTAAQRLRDAGFACPEISVGSSPTAMHGEFAGVTEVRAGVYSFWDLFQSNLGLCRLDEIAVSVLGAVIGQRRDRGWLILDAGGHALSKDRGTANQALDYHFGQVCRLDGMPIEGWRVTKANQEHGIVESFTGPIDFDAHPIGSRLRVLPNHACATAACHDGYAVVDGGREVVATWPRINGW